MTLKVIGFVGMPASGKSEAATVAREMGIPVVVMGDVVRAHMNNLDVKINEKNVGLIANKLRDEHGMDAVAKLCIPIIKSQKSDIVVIDGIRGYAEVVAYKNEFDENFKVIAIEASPKLRYERAKKRARSDDVVDYASFKAKDDRELSWGLAEAINCADLRVLNEGPLEMLRSLISDILVKQFNTEHCSTKTTINVVTPLHLTESKEKVEMAIRNIFPDIRFDQSNDFIRGTSNSIETFGALLKSQRIRSAARIELLKRLSTCCFKFILNKQVAFMGKVNFSEDPLGPIYITVHTNAPKPVIDSIAPETVT